MEYDFKKALTLLAEENEKEFVEGNNDISFNKFRLPGSENENQSLPMEFDAKDIANASASGVADTVTFLLDIPQKVQTMFNKKLSDQQH